MQVLGAIDAQAHQELVFLEKLTPLLVQQKAIRLQIVLDLLPAGVFLLNLDDLTVEVESQQRWLAPMPGEYHRVSVLVGDVLPNELLQQVVGDWAGLCVAQQALLVQVVAVGAIDIASRANWLDGDME